jgi:predicted ArsR family transcriptional regulator
MARSTVLYVLLKDGGMLQAERRSRIVAELQERPAVSVGELAELVGTSEMTIRRDLSALASAGLVRKVHGGAVAVRQQALAFDAVGMVNVRAKQAIASSPTGRPWSWMAAPPSACSRALCAVAS